MTWNSDYILSHPKNKLPETTNGIDPHMSNRPLGRYATQAAHGKQYIAYRKQPMRHNNQTMCHNNQILCWTYMNQTHRPLLWCKKTNLIITRTIYTPRTDVPEGSLAHTKNRERPHIYTGIYIEPLPISPYSKEPPGTLHSKSVHDSHCNCRI